MLLLPLLKLCIIFIRRFQVYGKLFRACFCERIQKKTAKAKKLQNLIRKLKKKEIEKNEKDTKRSQDVKEQTLRANCATTTVLYVPYAPIAVNVHKYLS